MKDVGPNSGHILTKLLDKVETSNLDLKKGSEKLLVI